jgi:hypothetical protein
MTTSIPLLSFQYVIGYDMQTKAIVIFEGQPSVNKENSQRPNLYI